MLQKRLTSTDEMIRATLSFESSVISYGSQTLFLLNPFRQQFESSVISYGSQTFGFQCGAILMFESSVISYGSQIKKIVLPNSVV